MTDPTPARRRNWPLIVIWSLGGVMAVALLPSFIASFPGKAAQADGHSLHGVDWALFARQSLFLRIHVVAVILATLLGTVMMIGVKGQRFHRIAGWTFAVLAVIAAFSAAVMGIEARRWAWIQLTIPFVLILLITGIMAARQHNVVRHRRLMRWQFYGSFVGAGLLTLLPGRLIWRLIFG